MTAIGDVRGTVLIVEDDEATAELERRTLSRSGMQVRTVSRVSDAVDLLQRESFAAVLLDYQLPDGDAWLVLEEARNRLPRIPVIVVTGMGNERVAAEAIHRGVTEYVKKTDSFWDQLPGIVDRVARLAQAEEQIRKSDALFHSIAENTSDWITIADLKGVYTYVSPACGNRFGYQPEEVVGGRALNFVHADDRELFERVTRSSSEPSRESVRLTYRHRRKDETYCWVEAHVSILKDAATGAPTEMLQIVRDISDRMKAEAAVQKEQERLADAQRIAHIGSWEFDIGTGEVTWSDELYRVFGLTKDAFRPSLELFLDRIHPDDRIRTREIVLRSLDDKRPFSCEYRTIRPDGKTRFVQAFGQAAVDESGRPIRVTGTVQDVTVRWELEQQVEARTRQISAALCEKEVLLKEIHHRVKNNLQVISSLINLQRRKLEHVASRSVLDECQTRVQAIALIHEKLYQSKDYSRVAFSEYARSLASNVFQTIDVSLPAISLDLAIDDTALAVDKAIPCGLVLNELITNCLKHGFTDSRPGTIRVEFSRLEDGRFRLAVKDDGVGLPEGFDVATSESLGLQLVSTLADQLDAELEVNGRAGTCVQLTFPAEG